LDYKQNEINESNERAGGVAFDKRNRRSGACPFPSSQIIPLLLPAYITVLMPLSLSLSLSLEVISKKSHGALPTIHAIQYIAWEIHLGNTALEDK
jgi:hypothetical protein